MSTGQSILQDREILCALPLLDRSRPHKFIKPVKKINEGQDVPKFLASCAYSDIGKFVMQLNFSMCPRRIEIENVQQIKTWELDSSDIVFSEAVQRIQNMLEQINGITDEVPPDTGPRRFGNVSFRKWYILLESRVPALLQGHLPASVLNHGSSDEATAGDELSAYLLGGFGSAQRLDYGTGHELSFLAFLGGIWKLGGFQSEIANQSASEIGRSIVLGIIEPYLRVVRRLIITYTLEPAGSHGVWGLDDHSFLPYIFGSAQYCPAITEDEHMPTEGSLPNSPNPGDIAKKGVVERERKTNMYFAAIGFINDVKTGPFWEHSPILFDISGVQSGWGKINKGMIKMYNAEVLSKFPVVQHFPFGSLFSWNEDLYAPRPPASVYPLDQPMTTPFAAPGSSTASWKSQQLPQESTRAPWAR